MTPTPTLTVDVLQSSISEPNGTSQATVTRSTGTSGTLVVNLSSNDVSEATVPLQVTIFEGSNSATFTVAAQDDTLVDGAQTVTISAAATGFTGGSDTLQVLDNDGGTGGDDHGNSSTTATTVGVPSLTSGNIGTTTDTDWFRFSATAGTQYTFETTLQTLSDSVLALYDTNGTTSLAENDDGGVNRGSKITWTVPATGTYYLQVKSYSSSYTGTYTLSVSGGGGTPGTLLVLDIQQTSISEAGGISSATVTRGTGTSGTLTVNLSSSDTTEAEVPTQVTIPNGSQFRRVQRGGQG